MVRTAAQAREQIVGDLTTAIDRISLATACLGEAYEQLDQSTADRLETELFRPTQRALARAKRTRDGFAARAAIPTTASESGAAGPGVPSQGVRAFVERAVAVVDDADRSIAELQDSMLPIEAGDAELRAGLAQVRDLLGGLPQRAREFLRTLGRG